MSNSIEISFLAWYKRLKVVPFYSQTVAFLHLRVFTRRQWKARFLDLNEIDSSLVKNVSALHQIFDRKCHYCVSLWRRSLRLSSMRKLEYCLRRDEQILLNFMSKFIDHDKSIRVFRKLFIKLSTRSRIRSSLTFAFRNSSFDDAKCSSCARSWNNTNEKNRTRKTTFESFELNLFESFRQ
jgi:hypothetical protein